MTLQMILILFFRPLLVNVVVFMKVCFQPIKVAMFFSQY